MFKQKKKRSGCFRFMVGSFVCLGLLIAAPVVYVNFLQPGMAFNVEDFMAVVDAADESGGPYQWNSPPLARLSKSEVNEVAQQLRDRYPFESLTDRLAYMEAANDESPVLNSDTLARLDEIEMAHFPRRVHALRSLHSNEVDHFINESGFGIYRMPPPSVLDLKYNVPQQPLNPIAVSSEYFTAPKIDLSEPYEFGIGHWPRVFLNEKGTPDMRSLANFHQDSYNGFSSGDQNGLIESRERVAGFESHAMHFRQWNGNLIQDQQDGFGNGINWKVNKLELVSLVVHSEPVVYVSDNLPRMDDLSEHDTRPLNAFESESLKRAIEGEDLIVNANLNRIEMLGSVRATKSCIECHGVKRGELLGAFSYELLRTPLHEPEENKEKPADDLNFGT